MVLNDLAQIQALPLTHTTTHRSPFRPTLLLYNMQTRIPTNPLLEATSIWLTRTVLSPNRIPTRRGQGGDHSVRTLSEGLGMKTTLFQIIMGVWDTFPVHTWILTEISRP